MWNIIQDKSFSFAVRVIKLYKYLTSNRSEYVLSKQLLRSWTSVWANVEEALWWQSKKDFVNKISIAYKEARESLYWIKLLRETDYITESEFASLEKDIDEILKILSKIKISSNS